MRWVMCELNRTAEILDDGLEVDSVKECENKNVLSLSSHPFDV
jgi:hypothetical protein